MKGLHLAMGFLAGIALLAAAASGVNLLCRPVQSQTDLVLVTGGSGPYWQRLTEGAAAAARESGALLRIETLDASNTVALQDELLERLAIQRHDGVAFCPLAPGVKSGPVNELSQSSKVLAYLRDVPMDDVLCCVLPGEYSAGKKAADVAINQLRGGGAVVALTSPGVVVSERLAGLDDQLRLRNAQMGVAEQTWNLVTIAVNPEEMERTAGRLRRVLQSGLRNVCVVSLVEGRVGELLNVVSRAVKDEAAKLIVFDQSREAFDAVAEGSVAATLMYDPFEMGRETITMLTRLCRSNELGLPSRGRGAVMLPAQVIDARNVEQFRTKLFGIRSLPDS